MNKEICWDSTDHAGRGALVHKEKGTGDPTLPPGPWFGVCVCSVRETPIKLHAYDMCPFLKPCYPPRKVFVRNVFKKQVKII